MVGWFVAHFWEGCLQGHLLRVRSANDKVRALESVGIETRDEESLFADLLHLQLREALLEQVLP